MNISLETFLISDTHFGQEKITAKEPLRTVIAEDLGFQNHFDLLVFNWNKLVGKDDKILHLGDVYFADGLDFCKKLNGRKRLIIGNNDTKTYENLKKIGWKAKNKVVLKIDEKHRVREKIRQKYGERAKSIYLNAIVCDLAGERIMFSHFPIFNRKIHDRFAAQRDVLDDYFRFSDCSLNIHGHTHSKNTQNRFCINVSCEKTRLAPVRLGDILARFKN